jgi:hypothetical protein
MLALREGAGRAAAIAAGVLLLPIPLLDQWGFSVRPDMLAILLSLAAGWTLLARPRQAWLAGLLAGLALLTKFTALSMPAVAVIWLIAARRFKDAVMFGVATSAVFAVGGGAALATSQGEAFAHTVIANANPLLPMEHALSVFTRLPTLGWFPFSVALVGIGLQLRARRLRLSGWYWLATLAVALFTLRGRGGDVNYLIEAAASTCWLAAHGLSSIWGRAGQRSPGFVVLAAMVLAACALWGSQTLTYWRNDGGVATDRRLPLAEIAASDAVLAEEPTMVLLAEKPLLVSDPFNLSQLETAGRFDSTDLVQRLRRHEFDLVVLRADARRTRYINGQPKWPEPVRKAIADYYSFSKRVDLYWLYVPDRPGR